MSFSQKHEDQPVAPALSRGSRQEDSYATPLATDPEDVETAIAHLELGRSDLDVRHDVSMDRSQGTIGLGTSAPGNPTLLELPGLQDATKTDITESVDPETKSFREKQPLNPVTRPENRPDLGTPEPSSLAAPVSSTASRKESGDSLESSDTLKLLMIDRLFAQWQSRAREGKILRDKHETILREAPLRLRKARLEVRRKSLSSPPEASPTTVAQNPDLPLPEYAKSGRKSLLSPPDAYSTAVASIPDPPPRDVPPGTKSFPSPPEVSSAAAALIPDPLPPKYAPPGISGSMPAMGEAEAFASRPIFLSASSPHDAVPLENTALGAPKSASMVGKIASLASRPHLDAPPPRRQDDPTLPPRSLAASPPPRHHDYPPSPPSSIYTSDDLCPYRKTFSCDIKALPAEFASHPARLAIVSLLELEPDNTNQLWCRRACYTEENFEQWVEWSSPSKTHRDQRSCMKELDKETLLKAPDLLDADKKILEDAWVEYRPYLLDKIQQALSVGCNWKKVLQKLNLAFSDSDRGYPRLKQYIQEALQDHVLIKYPLLHADLLFYHLDASYSEKGTRNPNRTRWEQTLVREPGEDIISLARRVEGAYLAYNHSPTITKETIYQLPENRRTSDDLYTRFKECLVNDVDNPARGEWMGIMCEEKWEQALHKYEKDQAQISRMPDVTPKQLAQLNIVATPPTLVDIAELLACLSVERHGNYDHETGYQYNPVSASATDPYLIKVTGTDERPGGVYRIPPRVPGNLAWRNSLDSAVLVQGDDESHEMPRSDGEPRSGMNSRDRRREARKNLQLEYKPQKPSKPPSYNAEYHNYETPSE